MLKTEYVLHFVASLSQYNYELLYSNNIPRSSLFKMSRAVDRYSHRRFGTSRFHLQLALKTGPKVWPETSD
jgi:hypothetical protein